MRLTDDGNLYIKTKINNSELKKQLTEAKRELNKFKKQGEKLNNEKLELEVKIKTNEKEYKQWIENHKKEYFNEIEVAKGFDGKIQPSVEKNITEKYQSKLDNYNSKSKYYQDTIELEKINKLIDDNATAQEKWSQKVDKLNNKMEQVESHDKLDKQINNVNESITKTIKKVGKWALALFGVRSAYTAIRSAASTLSQYNKQIGTDLEYIKFAIATSFEKIITKIIDLVYKLLAYIKYLAKEWFNINLFSNATAKNFNKANSNAKKLSKTLAGFDEINKLDDNSDSGGLSTPSMDLSKSLDNVEIPDWLVKFKDFCQPVIDFFKGIIEKEGAVGVIKAIVIALGGFIILKTIAKLIKDLAKGVAGSVDFTGFFDSLGKAAEAIAILGGLTLVIESICELMDSFSESGMSLGEVAALLGIALGEVAGAFIILLGAMTLLQPSWQSIAAAAVIFGGLALVLNSVTKLIDTFSKSGMSLSDVGILLGSVFTVIVGLMASIALLGPAMTAGLGPFLVLIAGISAILLVMAATIPTILDACGNFITTVAPAIESILKTIGNLITNIILALGKTLPPIINSVGNLFEKVFKGASKVIESVGSVIVKIMQTTDKLVTSVLKALLNFINKLGPAINNFVDNAIQAVTKLINFIVSGIEYLINTLIIDSVNAVIGAMDKILEFIGMGGKVKKISHVEIARFKPKLMATGGIIDVPKRGVPLANGVVGGEAGPEGVLPLTNESTMSRLGQEIGRWVTVDITNLLTMNGRVLLKELIKLNAENSFARNGG